MNKPTQKMLDFARAISELINDYDYDDNDFQSVSKFIESNKDYYYSIKYGN